MNKRERLFAQMKSQRKKSIFIGIILLNLIGLVVLISIYLGRAEFDAMEILKVIWGKITYQPNIYENIKNSRVAIIWDIRLPRILTGLFVGAGLAVAGTVFQSLLMNPLADPYTIGVSTGAAFGASLVIYFNIFFETVKLPVIPFAFAGAILTLILVIYIASVSGNMHSGNLIIAGIIVSSILSAGISFIKNAADEEVSAIIFWIMGSLAAKTWGQVLLVMPIVLVGSFICMFFAQDLNILCLGEEDAKSLGVNTNKMRKVFLIIGALITAACVSVSGVIGFVGLIIPHLLRFAVSTDNRVLIPLSGLLGALILMVADNLSRILFVSEIPVGVLTTLIGGPFFIYIFIRRNKYV